MKTLLFCTAYLSNPGKWRSRYHRWLTLYRQIPLEHDAIFMFDDASPHRPDDPDVRVVDALPDALAPGGVYLYRFAEHLGRDEVEAFPGWWRGFAFSLDVAERYAFEKILHVESDAYLLSGELVDYLNALDTGWTALWCPHYRFPEVNVQIICRDRFAELRAATARAFTNGCRQMPELTLPFTHVEKSFVGDRYAEYLDEIPADADYATQVLPKMTIRYRP
jgi:hypothetical protein